MLQPERYTLTETPTRIDVSRNDNRMGQGVVAIAQEPGTIVVCRDADGYASGARIKVVEGSTIEFEQADGVWLASPVALAVDVIETGVG